MLDYRSVNVLRIKETSNIEGRAKPQNDSWSLQIMFEIPLFPCCQFVSFVLFGCLTLFFSQPTSLPFVKKTYLAVNPHVQGTKVSSFWCKSSALPLTSFSPSDFYITPKMPKRPRISGRVVFGFVFLFFLAGKKVRSWLFWPVVVTLMFFSDVLDWWAKMNYRRHHSGDVANRMVEIRFVMVFKQSARQTNHSTRTWKWMTSATKNAHTQSTELTWRFLAGVPKPLAQRALIAGNNTWQLYGWNLQMIWLMLQKSS